MSWIVAEVFLHAFAAAARRLNVFGEDAKPVNDNAYLAGHTVYSSPSKLPCGAKVAADTLDALKSLEKSPSLSREVFQLLHELYSGEDVPLHYMGLLDDILPEKHPFFNDDKMDSYTKGFLSSVLIKDAKGIVTLDTSHYDIQFKHIADNLSKALALTDKGVGKKGYDTFS